MPEPSQKVDEGVCPYDGFCSEAGIRRDFSRTKFNQRGEVPRGTAYAPQSTEGL